MSALSMFRSLNLLLCHGFILSSGCAFPDTSCNPPRSACPKRTTRYVLTRASLAERFFTESQAARELFNSIFYTTIFQQS
ncbi:hypothetical protein SISNIDRAFT_71152 [Sistotremastrum niveocremeum HHB9708]|uniref:Secreted protein n=1 Tax=Sistotremastrum niveocremeum HHB9708 TaxID=1314777 RepID=A0A164V735_9AGAM|nr:hypothetical protein SISNIDRAFT_71152 [Sistotremastrum niveocremeum HHB9708]